MNTPDETTSVERDSGLVVLGMQRLDTPSLKGERVRGLSTRSKVGGVVLGVALAVGAVYGARAVAERPVGSGDTDIVYKILNGTPFQEGGDTGSQLTPLEDVDAEVEGE